MRRIVIAALLIFLGVGGIAAYFKYKLKPPLETKFVQNVDIEQSIKQENTTKNIQIKTPGDYALVDNPKHTYQTFNNCGPATLSMILSWYGKDVSQKELGDQMRPFQIPSGDNDDKTIFTYEFVNWAEKYGVEAISRVNGDIDLLKNFTANGIPVVVKTWLHVGDDIGHFRIVRGFDESKGVIIQDDSYEGPNRKFSYYDFLSIWQPFNYAFIIVYDDTKKELVEAIIGKDLDEKIAWENALERAKKESELADENVYAWFNMATSYYHLGDYQNSVTAFENVESRLPKRMLWYQIEPIQAYKELGNYDRVFQITDKILNNGNRAYSELYQIRGEIYLAQGNKDPAKREFELAVQYNKNFTPAQESLKAL
ncbi:hypothetical protein A2715_02075 [Candidatus Woesebacteria bacterium RIFCSPHIGHO2_01_FULL_39_32]|uniref:Tetratricopeptide TPR_1 repeat-containing protein n=2 Tax=Candidatus Woeseibacteriota TaxID=1752722 RepID=A0A0G0Q077_9BACT|nr:MAG: Tetratricopeptide TPR_1 repeat-containing protein [Candidatus Woesebacteria bacterium GW2011_GWA1_39_8]OGM03445.1 MAG: hypothetical protein A2124_02310 [Candidatus Woesebacteria bacterium GWB1_37_5]OGM23942.1 MAG: hypothetical protein A2715_02075 [Candidatus Woesebacteria bacterium RIFCSPHIGHO2_01_FULL_39_32]OGM37448.1 MAG: hypothetical protein A3F01_03310 [Candidatus Woesebacteria bacterium RIFCSPHIGHO2_12_FULL_38_11]OGM64131.1 MAG: hypothetical protein A2893_03315 [Candidatus Woesebac